MLLLLRAGLVAVLLASHHECAEGGPVRMPEVHFTEAEAAAATNLTSELAHFVKSRVGALLEDAYSGPEGDAKYLQWVDQKGGMGNQLQSLAGGLILAACTGRRIQVMPWKPPPPHLEKSAGYPLVCPRCQRSWRGSPGAAAPRARHVPAAVAAACAQVTEKSPQSVASWLWGDRGFFVEPFPEFRRTTGRRRLLGVGGDGSESGGGDNRSDSAHRRLRGGGPTTVPIGHFMQSMIKSVRTAEGGGSLSLLSLRPELTLLKDITPRWPLPALLIFSPLAAPSALWLLLLLPCVIWLPPSLVRAPLGQNGKSVGGKTVTVSVHHSDVPNFLRTNKGEWAAELQCRQPCAPGLIYLTLARRLLARLFLRRIFYSHLHTTTTPLLWPWQRATPF